LYERVSQNLMLTKRFMTPHLLTAFRQYIVQNVNLAAVFDTLGLAELLDIPAPLQFVFFYSLFLKLDIVIKRL
jgi:hypothetical protein